MPGHDLPADSPPTNPSRLAQPSRGRRPRTRTLLTATLAAAALAVPLVGVAPAALAASTSTYVTASASYPTLRYDSRGAAVKRLQRLLGVKPVSGWFGPLTKAAVMRFEKRHHMKVNGVVGGPTWRAILRAHAASTASSRSVRKGRTCPVPGARFTDTYGAPRSKHPHAGVDLLAKRGTKIHAVESGTIVRAHWSGSSGGYTITLKGRSGSKFFYAHNDKNLVKAGQNVKVGQVIARVGSTGNAGTVNQLHFEYWKSGRESDPVNPTPLVRSLCS
jgi:murein DD-endopeptidase MepM/ murein hydrolase activator NlpD